MSTPGKKLMRSVMHRGGLANFLGAILLMIYFIYFSVHIPADNPQRRIIVTIIVAALLSIGSLGWSMRNPEPRKMLKFFNVYLKNRPDQKTELEIIDYTARMPWEAAKISFRTWFIGGVIFSILFWFDAQYALLGGGVDFTHVPFLFFGVVVIGGGFSATFTFLLTEWMVSSTLPQIFLKELLCQRLPSHYLKLQNRLMLLFIVTGIVPLLTVGIITFTSDINRIGPMLGSIVIFGLLMAVVSSLFLTRGISRSVDTVKNAAARVRQGDLDAEVMVTAPDELGELQASFNHMVRGLKERDYIKDIFGRYVTRQVVDEVLSGNIDLGGELRQASILFSDIRGFTRMSAELSPTEVVAFLNDYLTRMVDAVVAEEGRLDKFIGDGLMAVFGAPQEHPDDAGRACRVALRMQEALQEINTGRKNKDLPAIAIGIGIHTGQVVAGNIGSEKKMEYTVIGDAVNVTSRIETLNKEFNTNILISDSTYHQVKDMFKVRKLPLTTVKGKEKPLQVYELLS